MAFWLLNLFGGLAGEHRWRDEVPRVRIRFEMHVLEPILVQGNEHSD